MTVSRVGRWRRRILKECRLWFSKFVMVVPGDCGSFLRTRLLSFKAIGKGVKLWGGGNIWHPSRITIGDNSDLNRDVIVQGGGGVDIGSDVLIGPRVIIYSQNHSYKDASVLVRAQGFSYERVIIEDDAWLCAACIILPGVTVRKGTVVAAGAVVTESTEPYSIVAGVPARKIGARSSLMPDHLFHNT